MRFKVFISSVQREFAAERQMLAEYVRQMLAQKGAKAQ